MTSSILKSQLSAFIRSGNAVALRDYLLSLRNSDFRMAGTVLSDRTLWGGADFWTFAAVLVTANSRAFLGTMLKAARSQESAIPTAIFADACVTDIDRQKALEALIPCVDTPAEVRLLLQLFRADDALAEKLLYKAGTAPAYFLLFNILKRHDDDAAYLRRFGIELIRKGDKLSFNLACVIKEYFGLSELPGTFSLSLQPYELSRLDVNYDSFFTILSK